jgi:hypothetical protein
LEQIKLNKENPKIEFRLNAEESSILIKSVYTTSQNNAENQWSDFISKVIITVELKYLVYDDQQGRVIDERSNKYPIHLFFEPHQVHPVFHLNKLIKNETFTLGIQTAQKFYQTLSLEIENFDSLFGDFTLEFHIEKSI